MTNLFTQLSGCQHPVVQAPIGGAASPRLAAAVSNAGGVGSLSLTWKQPIEVANAVRAFRQLSTGPLNANFVLDFSIEEQLEAALGEGASIISFFWGDPGPLVERVRQAGSVPIVVVGAVDEARRAADRGAAVIVAQGREAGGHVRGDTGLISLLPAVIDAVSPLPVLAAGGIVDARGSAAAKAMGAAGVWVGTRFVASEESDAHPGYKDAVCRSRVGDTLLSRLFDGDWPNAPARTLRNSTSERWEQAGRPSPGRREGEGEIVGTTSGNPVPRYHSDAPTRTTEGEIEAMALYAGEGAALIDKVLPAARIVEMLAAPWLAETNRNPEQQRQWTA